MNYNKKDLVQFRISKARENFKEAEQLAKGEFWNGAINRLYYSVFHSALAILASKNIKTSTHSGVKNEFFKLYFKTKILDLKYSKLYTNLLNKRQESDYDDFIVFEKEDVEFLFPQVKEFIKVIETLLK